MTTDQTPPNDTGAPERIWATHDRDGDWLHGFCSDALSDDTGAEYVRADISAAREAAAALEMREAAATGMRRLDTGKSTGADLDYNLAVYRCWEVIKRLTPPTDPAAALDRLIAEARREAVEATWRDVEAALEKEINAEWFTSEVNGKPVTSKGETEFMRLTEAKRVFDMLKANVRAARGSKEGQP